MTFFLYITYAPEPVDDQELFIHLHHEDDEEDDGKDHLTNSHGRESATPRRCVTDDDDQAQELQKDRRDEDRFRGSVIRSTNIATVFKHLPFHVVCILLPLDNSPCHMATGDRGADICFVSECEASHCSLCISPSCS